MPGTTTMRERLARALFKADSLRGLHHYEWEDMPCVDHDEYFSIIDAILSELEKPTPEMAKIGATTLLTAGGYDVEKLDHYDYPPDMKETEAEFLAAFAAAIRVAKETK